MGFITLEHSPPFGRNIFLELCSNHQRSESKTMFIFQRKSGPDFNYDLAFLTPQKWRKCGDPLFSPDLRLFFIGKDQLWGQVRAEALYQLYQRKAGNQGFGRCHPMIHWDMRCGGDDGELLIYAYDHSYYYS